jgi:glycerophosphoryl diester phosphodiesterase
VVAGRRENTLDSYRAAVEAGLRWVEVDARFTADDALVARHDPVADDGRFISELTAKETDELGLLRVADLLGELAPEIGIDLEVKSSLEDAGRARERTTAALAADLVARQAGRRPVLVSSFDPAALLIVRERLPQVPLGLITWIRFPLRKAIPAAVHLGADVLAAHVDSFPLEESVGPAVEREPSHVIRVAHEAGLQVMVWCPGPDEGDTLVAAGIDCLVVDDVPAAIAHYRQPALGVKRPNKPAA